VNSRERIMAECGDILLAIKEKSITENHIPPKSAQPWLGERTSAGEITLYKSAGIAVQDVAGAQLIYRKALELQVGTNVDI
jgi:ornithine cyclodeaminase/alanine dehydrogenase-like protein (mu-crystallin family)